MYMMNRHRQMRGRVQDMNPIREMRVHVTCLIKVYDEPESPSKGTFSIYMMTRICQ